MPWIILGLLGIAAYETDKYFYPPSPTTPSVNTTAITVAALIAAALIVPPLLEKRR